MTVISIPARPKINLFLHVTGRRADGYHLLESLVCFADAGDRITASPADDLLLHIQGPFSDGLEVGAGNLVLRAATALQEWANKSGQIAGGGALKLDKYLPIASGIGGGSADAAATFTALSSLWKLQIPEEELATLALSIGADVPVCLESRTRMMRGIGDILEDAPVLPPAWVLLVNPMREVSTAKVFSALDLSVPSTQFVMPSEFETAEALGMWLKTETRNDLEDPALTQAPEIATVLKALADCDGCHIARMSGSGATCFALFGEPETAEAAARRLTASHDDWWVQAAKIT